jgi:DNA polymerase
MTKKLINQKGKLDEVLINTIEPNFIFQTNQSIDLT